MDLNSELDRERQVEPDSRHHRNDLPVDHVTIQLDLHHLYREAIHHQRTFISTYFFGKFIF